MSKKRHPIQHKPFLNFDTFTSDLIEEDAVSRTARMQKLRNARRAETMRQFRAADRHEYGLALDEALCRARAGQMLPIHFDVRFENAGVTRTNRYSLKEVVYSDSLFEPGEVVASTTIVTIRRSASELPHFVHHARFGQYSEDRASDTNSHTATAPIKSDEAFASEGNINE